MFDHLRPLITGSEHSISNSRQFLESTKHTKIAFDVCMVAFDVVPLFRCIPFELKRETSVNLLVDFDFNLPPTATIEKLDHCLSNCFQFGNCLYQQVNGMRMGSPISGIIAEAAQQRLEQLVFSVIEPKFWKLFVDQVSSFHQLLNITLPGIDFTMEKPTNGRLHFLDM